MRRRTYLLICLACSCWTNTAVLAQHFDMTKAIAAQVELDSVVITAGAFDVEDFIRLVEEDESLVQAFRYLRLLSHQFTTEMAFTDKKQAIVATYRSTNQQAYDGSCRSMKILSEKWTGNFFKGRKHKQRYYTYSLYDALFVTHGVVCTTENTDSPMTPEDAHSSSGGMDKHIRELKSLIFRPGHKADLPFFGRKTEIFSAEMLPYYTFQIQADTLNGIPCYVFIARAKEGKGMKENDTVYKYLYTAFTRADFQVLSRKYTLSQDALLYTFDVTMDVVLTKFDDMYVPHSIDYSGMWNIPGKRREDGTFSIQFTGFQ